MTDFKDLPLEERQKIMRERNRNGRVPSWVKFLTFTHFEGGRWRYFPLWVLTGVILGWISLQLGLWPDL